MNHYSKPIKDFPSKNEKKKKTPSNEMVPFCSI